MSTEVSGLGWQRLSIRVVWVDLGVTALSLLPGVLALVVTGGELSAGVLIPLAILAVVGVTGALADMVRWAFTWYRVTQTDIERRAGVLVREHRTLRRDRVRSVDRTAKLRHRLAGLRVVTIGAGQQTGAGESALVLDALPTADAESLRHLLLDDEPSTPTAHHGTADPVAADLPTGHTSAEAPVPGEDVEVLQTFRTGWVVFHMLSIWAFLMAAGLMWVGYWVVGSFGVDVVGMVAGLVDWDALGLFWTVVVAALAAGAVGAIGLGVTFLLGYWGFELARVRTGGRSYLRTRRGLLSTREVSRDESRIRGLTIAEPLLWRWMGMADTTVITTGLNVWDPEQPTGILPRGPIDVARRCAGAVLGEDHPFEAPLRPHPRGALRRRLWWAMWVALAAPAALAVPALSGAVPWGVPVAALGLLPVAALAAVIAYRSLGHTIAGPYLVTRSGLMTRTTSALRRDAVSTIVVRQSVLQRRLGLSTVAAMTAAGWSAYEARDVAAAGAVAWADEAAPSLLGEFRESAPEQA